MKRKIIFIILTFSIMSIMPTAKALDTSKSSVVMDLNSGRVLYQKNANEKRLIASITNIMTTW